MNKAQIKAMSVVLETARKYGAESVDDADEIFEATYVVQNFLDNEVLKKGEELQHNLDNE